MPESQFVARHIDFTTPSEDGISGGIVLDEAGAPAIENCLGAISLSPRSRTETLAHATSEVMYVAQGTGRVHTDDGLIEFCEGTAIFIPARANHSLENTGSDPVISVFSFPTTSRPETWSPGS